MEETHLGQACAAPRPAVRAAAGLLLPAIAMMTIMTVMAMAGARRADAAWAGTPGDWQQFGYDPRHSGFTPLETTLTPETVVTLRLLYSADLPGTVDDAPVFLSDVATSAGLRDLLFVTTTDGRVVAIDAATGKTVWSHQPATGPGYTTSSPAIDPGRRLVYSYGLEGKVHAYRAADGAEVTGNGWPELATLKPQVEKCSPALAVAPAANGHTYLYVANGGYPGDQGDYQGHVTAVDLASGAQQVWNADCSNQPVHFTTNGSPDCAAVQSAVWARGGVVYDSDLDRIFFATGNGQFDVPQGGHDWGDTVLALHPDGTGSGTLAFDSYTPSDFAHLNDSDLDLGSTAPVVLPPVPGSTVAHLGVQSGKDAQLRLLNLANLSGAGRPGQVGGELQIVAVPQGGEVLTAPAVWTDPATGTPWIVVANDSGISALQVVAGGGHPALKPVWSSGTGGTSPVLANGMVFYVGAAGLQALAIKTGKVLWSDPRPGAAGIHWQSPIVVEGRVYVADQGNHLWAFAPASPSTCHADAQTLCLAGNRFQVQAEWQTATASGQAQAVTLTGDTGYFWFFAASNVEMVAKVLDGCAVNSRYWLFAGGLTNVQVAITVVDTDNGAMRTYLNPQSTPFAPIQDTSAFATCP